MKPADPIRQRQAMTRKLERRMACEGKVSLPAVPGMVGDYTRRCAELFAALGRRMSDPELAQLEKILDDQLKVAFRGSQRSSITVSYRAEVCGALHYFVAPQHATLEQAYEAWVSTRQPPYFGTGPDAKVIAMAGQVGGPRGARVLDIGAGTGRNALALARLGFPVDAVEPTPKFAEILEHAGREEALDVRVIRRDVFEAEAELAGGYRWILLSEVVSDFRSMEQLRALFELAGRQLAADGMLLLNAFVTRPHYSADDAAREFAQQVYSCFFTPQELAAACEGLPLEPISDESAHDYEKSHLPADAWPPTGWYPEWVTGLDVFDLPMQDSPIELRWLAFRKVTS
jgi:SAM-dependent methyltransferase